MSTVHEVRAFLGQMDYECEASDLREVLTRVTRALEALEEEIRVLGSSAQCAAVSVAAMTRTEALDSARAHVEAMSTNTRGFQDGVRLTDKVEAVHTLARFLLGEGDE